VSIALVRVARPCLERNERFYGCCGLNSAYHEAIGRGQFMFSTIRKHVSLLVYLASVAIWNINAFVIAEAQEQECRCPQPCTELKLPHNIAETPTRWVSTANGDFQALNLGYKVDLTWKDQPSATQHVVLYRSTSRKGPWKNVMDIPANALAVNTAVSSVSDLRVNGTTSDLYYRVVAIDAAGKPLRRYGTLRVPKYGQP
jgi:hypothetical protein